MSTSELARLRTENTELRRRLELVDAELVEYATSSQVHGDVQSRLPAQGRQQRVGTLGLDDLLDVLPGDRFDISPIRHLGIGHDRGGVRVDQCHLVSLFAQRLAGLRAGILELAACPVTAQSSQPSRSLSAQTVATSGLL